MHIIQSEDIAYTANSERLFNQLRDLPDAIWLDSGKPRSLQGATILSPPAPSALSKPTATVQPLVIRVKKPLLAKTLLPLPSNN